MKTHRLKTWPVYFQLLLDGVKTFEVRENDRHFMQGDVLVLREWNPKTERYTGRELRKRAGYILDNGFGLPDNMCIISLLPAPAPKIKAEREEHWRQELGCSVFDA